MSLKELVIFSFFISTIFIGLFFYQSKLRKLNKKLKKLSTIDKLTNLYNRFYIDKTLIYEKAKVDRKKDYQSSIILLDIDHFKTINDTFGHFIGDKVLVEVSELLKLNLRNIDIIGRWGGEEFLIILPFTSKENAKIVAENLRVLIENSDILKAYDRKITASFGLEEILKDRTIDETLICTDKLLYKAKKSGRNKIF